MIGLAVFGVGVALLIHAELGAAPWDVLHDGLSELTGISVGVLIILTGVATLALWVPLRERPGLPVTEELRESDDFAINHGDDRCDAGCRQDPQRASWVIWQ